MVATQYFWYCGTTHPKFELAIPIFAGNDLLTDELQNRLSWAKLA